MNVHDLYVRYESLLRPVLRFGPVLGLLAARIALHDYIGHFISPLQTAALFYLMACGMIVRWRSALYIAYRRLTADRRPSGAPAV